MREKAFTYLLASGLMVILLMVAAVFAVVILNGIPNFWPRKLVRVEMNDGTAYLGEIHGRTQEFEKETYRIRLKIGNREINNQDFVLLSESNIKNITTPRDALLLERLEWGNAYGYCPEMNCGELKRRIEEAEERRDEIRDFHKKHLMKLNEKIADLKHDLSLEEDVKLEAELEILQTRYDEDENRLMDMRREAFEEVLTLTTADGRTMEIPFFNLLHVYNVNGMSFFAKLRLFFYRMIEFVFMFPRESNTEGGVFPALYGTVLLVFLMSIAVFPLGVITSVYLHEYAKSGPILRLIRITIFNLAGVPSIVYGVFGLGFFIYAVGGTIDEFFFSDYLPNPTFGTGGILWASLTLAVLTLPVVVVASLEGLQSVPEMYREGAFALGATRWEVIRDVVIPNAMPGMLTGLILAISRAAGEVAPLMLTGVVKSAPSLPLDGTWPFLHLDRKFMHLGFHIYDVGFQSPNVEAARPMVFNTTLLLLVVVFLLNLVAIVIRNKLRKKFMRSGV